MKVLRKSSRRTGTFWLITFKNREEKREILDELRLTEDCLNECGKDHLYALLRKLSKRCEHDDKYQKDDEIATCLFDSDIADIIMFMSSFAFAIKTWYDVFDDYEEHIERLNKRIAYLNKQIKAIGEQRDKYIELLNARTETDTH